MARLRAASVGRPPWIRAGAPATGLDLGGHLPLFFLPGADKYGLSFPVWTLQAVALSVAITWLYAGANGSLLLTMLMHSAVNQTVGIVPSANLHLANPFTLKVSR